MSDSIIEINGSDLTNLLHLYKSNEAKSYIGYLTIANYIGFFQKDPNIKHVKVYCLNGEYSDGTFVVTDRNRGYADTLNENFENLSRLLKLVNYSTGYRFLTIRPEIRPILKSSLQSVNIEVISDERTILYRLPREEALKFAVEPPAEIQLKSIVDLKDIEHVSEMWRHHDATSFPYVQRLVKFNQHIGAFNEEGTLVAWILRLPVGILGGLKTKKDYYGRGYGSLVTRFLAKQIAQTGDDVYCSIYPDNTPSHSLFKKLGFKPVGEVFFLSTKITWSLTDE